MLFALRDLRHLEAERCADERRIEEQRRVAEEQRRRAEEAERIAEEQRRRDAEAQRLREQDEREVLASALRETSVRNAVLESDVQEVRALVAAAAPPAQPRRSRWPVAAVCISAAALVVAILARQQPARERVVYVASPAPIAAPAPIATPAPIAPLRPRAKARPHLAKPAPKPASVDDCGGKDPLCGMKL